MVHIYPALNILNKYESIEDTHVIVRKSNIPGAGNGVFAKKDIMKGEDLGYYTGEIISEEEFHKRYDDEGYGEYVLYLSDPNKKGKFLYVDSKYYSNWVSRINASRKTGKRANVYWDTEGHVFACRNIKEGEELLVNYGSEYWKGKERGTTRKVKKATVKC